MREIGLFEAKTKLSAIAQQVKQTGEPVTLTKHGQPYVDLVPHGLPSRPRRTKKQVLADLADFRREVPKSSAAHIRSQIEEGRR